MRNQGSQPTQTMRHDVSLLDADDLHLFNEGTHYRLYNKLGARPMACDGVQGTYFAVWAPNAESVYAIGDFNGWNKRSHPLQHKGSSGIWEGFVPAIAKGAIYKFHIVSRHNNYSADKADPFAVHAETPPKTGSLVWDTEYAWGDQDWMRERRQHNALDAP